VISPEEERKATVGRICRKVRFSAWNEGVRGDGKLIIISMNVTKGIRFRECLPRAPMPAAVYVCRPQKLVIIKRTSAQGAAATTNGPTCPGAPSIEQNKAALGRYATYNTQ